MRSVLIVVCLSSSCLAQRLWNEIPCVAAVRADVQVAASTVSASDLLEAGSCRELKAAAAGVRLGAQPRAGSPRVMEGDRVRAVLRRIADQHLPHRLILFAVPERVVLRAEPATPRVPPPYRTIRKRVHTLVRPGQRLELIWEEKGIRLKLSAVCLEAADAGQTIRVKFVRSGRVIRALVLPDGTLRASS